MKSRNQPTFGKLKGFTKNYLLKNGRYKKRRILSSVRIYGMVSNFSKNACEEINVPINEKGSYKKKMRSKVKKRFTETPGDGNQLSTTPVTLFSEHNQRGEIFTMDFRQN